MKAFVVKNKFLYLFCVKRRKMEPKEERCVWERGESPTVVN